MPIEAMAQTARVAEDPVGDDYANKEYAGMLEALHANLQAIVRGDVYVRVRVSFDSVEFEDAPTGLLNTADWRFRFRFDYEHERFLLVESREGLRLDMSTSEEDAASVSEHFQVNALVINGHEARVRSLPQRPVGLKNIRWQELLQRQGVPDLRHVGLVAFPSSMPNDRLPGIVHRLSQADEPVRVIASDQRRTRFETILRKPSDPDFYLKITSDFDAEMLVLTRRKVEGVQTAPTHRTGLVDEERFQWKEMSGVMVPIRINQSTPTRRAVGDRHEHAVEELDVELTWLSVNKPFKDEDFDPKLLDSDEALARMIDESEIAEAGSGD